ncbi:MAG: hypothetical protein IJ607_05270 [Bacteroidaceae bacterium]|nr:hypothetical protein [Bacteroidaceae bacterium]
MRKSIFSLLFVGIIMLFASSCSTKQSAISRLERFSYELRDNGEFYSFKDWEKAADEFTSIRKKINKYNYTSQEKQYIGELEGKCAGYVYKGVKGKITGYGNEVNGILQGLFDIINH